MSRRWPTPLDHRVRRRILRFLHTDFGKHSVNDVARELRLDVSEVRYHGAILAGWRKVSQIEGPDGDLLESLVTEDPEVIALLIATKAEDEAE
jgi:Helix-turn-helix domain